jgi:hypothetical protein
MAGVQYYLEESGILDRAKSIGVLVRNHGRTVGRTAGNSEIPASAVFSQEARSIGFAFKDQTIPFIWK